MDLQFPASSQKTQEIYWPIFGEKYPNNVKKFWNKGKNEIQANEKILFEQELLRIGKRKTKLKTYIFKIDNEFNCFYLKKKTDKTPKGMIKLNETIQIKLSQLTQEKDKKRLGIKLYRTEKVTYTILADNPSLIFKLWEILSQICVMVNFDEMHQPMNVLGKGSFATVYKVRRTFDDLCFAAKIYYKDTLASHQHKDKFVNMVKNEVEILRKCEHENIVKVHEIYQQQDKVVIIMDYVAGPDLYQLIKRKKYLSEKNSAIIIQQLAQALNDLSMMEYVHRDLKLENILLLSNESYKVKIVVSKK